MASSEAHYLQIIFQKDYLMSLPSQKTYSVSKLKGHPFFGMLFPILKDPLGSNMEMSQNCGDIITFSIAGRELVQLNHPDLIRYVLVENHKNYKKSKPYFRFESALGLGLLTSSGDKWKRDRQKIQPMFNREKISGIYFDIVHAVTEKHKQQWLKMTENGACDIVIEEAMEKITTEVILKAIYGNDIDDEMIFSLHHSYGVMVDYLGPMRVFPKIDSRKLFCSPSYFKFKNALADVNERLKILTEQYKKHRSGDAKNLLELMIEAKFSDHDIRDHCTTMVFAGFETTTILMKWFWYVMDERADIKAKLRDDITSHAPCTLNKDSTSLNFMAVQEMKYLSLVLKETMRLYPPFWISGREPIEDDYLGDFKVTKGTSIALSQIAMHRHPKWWKNPNSFIPERFLPENEANISDGLYFPFSLGPRACSGQAFAEMEAKMTIAKLLPYFDVTVLNKLTNPIEPGISLKHKHKLAVRISRVV